MAVFQNYEERRKLLMGQIQTLQDFEKSDEIVKFVFDIAREILSSPADIQNVEWLAQKGFKLAGYMGVLEGRGNESWSQYKVAEIAFKNVRDALMMSIKDDKATITEARAEAGRESQEAEVDVIVRELRSKNYYTAAKICEKLSSFIQTTMKYKQSELSRANMPDQRRY